jgi:hypothetical protein
MCSESLQQELSRLLTLVGIIISLTLALETRLDFASAVDRILAVFLLHRKTLLCYAL